MCTIIDPTNEYSGFTDSNEVTTSLSFARTGLSSAQTKLNAFCSSGRIPHLLFHGASGTGKKTMVQQFIHKIYAMEPIINEVGVGGSALRDLGPEAAEQFRGIPTPPSSIYRTVMWVNCAQRKGIKFIREDLKFFAQTNVSADVPFKTIVLLNADYLTNDAQSALRRCMEQYSQTTRFFGIVQNKRRLLFPILSRFCEIYIPLETHGTKNLHQQKIDALFSSVSFGINPSEFIHTRLNRLCLEEEPAPNGCIIPISQLITIVSELYDYGLSSLDLLHYIKSTLTLCEESDKYRIVNVLMQINTEHIEFRNERLCMLRILQLYLFRTTCVF
jgi:hypothetical protein